MEEQLQSVTLVMLVQMEPHLMKINLIEFRIVETDLNMQMRNEMIVTLKMEMDETLSVLLKTCIFV